MAAGNGRNGDSNTEGKPDRNEQVQFQQAHEGAHERFIAQIANAANTGDNQVAQGEKQAWGPTKDGGFNYASPEQVAQMSTKDLAKYVGDHDKYVQAQVDAHPERINKICAQYSGRLDDDLVKQTKASVDDFYTKLGKAIQA